MNKKFRMLLAGSAVCFPAFAAQFAVADDETQTKKAVVVVRADDHGDMKAVKEKVIEQLKKSGVSDEIQQKVLKELEQAMEKATSEKKEGKADGKTAITTTVTAVEKKDGKGDKQQEAHVFVVNGEEFKGDAATIGNKIGQQFRAKVFRSGQQNEPSYRIGIALEAKEEASANAESKDDKSNVTMTIESVIDDSPAAKAGVKEGDLVVKVNSKELGDVTTLQEIVQAAGKEDKTVTLTLNRDGKEITVDVKPAKTDASDIAIQGFELMPQNGFMVDAENLKEMQAKVLRLGHANVGSAFSFVPSAGNDLKQELADLKKEIAELKEMIKELSKK